MAEKPLQHQISADSELQIRTFLVQNLFAIDSLWCHKGRQSLLGRKVFRKMQRTPQKGYISKATFYKTVSVPSHAGTVPLCIPIRVKTEALPSVKSPMIPGRPGASHISFILTPECLELYLLSISLFRGMGGDAHTEVMSAAVAHHD